MDKFNFLKEIEKQCEINGNKTALKIGAQSIDYKTLKIKSDIWANKLKSRKLYQKPIGICIKKSPELIIVILGIMKAGGICVPLDKTYPEDRLKYIVKTSKVNLIIHDENKPEFLGGEQIMYGVEDEGNMEKISDVIDSETNQILYHLYTSGSTGVPKGIEMKVQALNNLIEWQNNESGKNGIVTLQFAPISFDVSFQEILSTLCLGHILILISDEDRFDLERVSEIIREENVTRIFMPFVAFNKIINYGQNLKSLKEINISGEQLKISDKIRNFFRNNECELRNQYGPTETHVVTQYCFNNDVNTWKELPPIGIPIKDVKIKLLGNEGDIITSKNVDGEIIVTGKCLFNGYVGSVSNSFIEIENEHYYRTGDLGYLDESDNYNFICRIDNQIKIRGYRVELSEIEGKINNISEVQESVAVFDSSEEKIKVVIIPFNIDNEVINVVKKDVKQYLPDYMMPSDFILIDKIPKTPSGKIDRMKILSFFNNIVENKKELSNNETIENVLFSIWSKLVGESNFDMNDNFFDIGGNSLIMYDFQERIKKELDIDIKITDLFNYVNINKLAEYIKNYE